MLTRRLAKVRLLEIARNHSRRFTHAWLLSSVLPLPPPSSVSLSLLLFLSCRGTTRANESLLSRRRDNVPGEQEIVFTHRHVARSFNRAADHFCLALVSDTRALINRDPNTIRPVALFQAVAPLPFAQSHQRIARLVVQLFHPSLLPV